MAKGRRSVVEMSASPSLPDKSANRRKNVPFARYPSVKFATSSLLVCGHWFGNLTPSNAVLLFCAPLLCWLPILPPRFRGVVRVAWAAVPVAVALTLARQQFVASSRTSSTPKERTSQPSPNEKEPSLQDYLDFKK